MISIKFHLIYLKICLNSRIYKNQASENKHAKLSCPKNKIFLTIPYNL